MSDREVIKAVEEFAAKYGMRICSMDIVLGRKTPEEKEQYIISKEWTDGDQLTFYVQKLKDVHRDWDENTCAASVDDWEEDRPALICRRLYDACLKHGIISHVEIKPSIDPNWYK